jgi:lactate dehydrogenase-like 2-hydroxyacid dehydrogenase
VRVSAGNYSLTPLVGRELKGKRAAVLGTGAIGTEAVRILKVGAATPVAAATRYRLQQQSFCL